jgi:hypothetical protein
MINGRPLYTNFAGAPPDFGAMVNDRLDYATRSLGALPSNGVTSPQDLFLQPVGADDLPANQAAWVIMKQGDTHFGPLVDKTGKPVVITMDDVNYARDSQARAHQAQVLEDNRQAQNRGALPPEPGLAGVSPLTRLLVPKNYVGGNVPKSRAMLELEDNRNAQNVRGLNPAVVRGGLIPFDGPAGDQATGPSDDGVVRAPNARQLLQSFGVAFLPDRSRFSQYPYGKHIKGFYDGAAEGVGANQHHPEGVQFHHARPPAKEIVSATSSAANELGRQPNRPPDGDLVRDHRLLPPEQVRRQGRAVHGLDPVRPTRARSVRR